jgi:hypothetical protein
MRFGVRAIRYLGTFYDLASKMNDYILVSTTSQMSIFKSQDSVGVR